MALNIHNISQVFDSRLETAPPKHMSARRESPLRFEDQGTRSDRAGAVLHTIVYNSSTNTSSRYKGSATWGADAARYALARKISTKCEEGRNKRPII